MTTTFRNGGMVDNKPEEWHDALVQNLSKALKAAAQAHSIRRVTEVNLRPSLETTSGPALWELLIVGDAGAWPDDKPYDSE